MPDATAPLPITLHTTPGDAALRFRKLSAVEELGRPYAFTVQAESDDTTLAAADLLGTKAAVSVQLPDASLRHFHGIVAAAGLEGVSGMRGAWRLVLRPWLWLLTRRADTRIFQAKTVKDILGEVFQPYAHDVAFELTGRYPAYEYCVQYRESDFDFVSRLMEREGLYYFFRHTADQHVMVVTDNMAAHIAFPGYETVPFREHTEAATDLEYVSRWSTHLEVQPGKVTLRDYDFIQPATLLESAHPSSRQGALAAYEVYDPPGDYRTASEGNRYAALRMEALDASWQKAVGFGNACGIAVGYRFTLADHPVAAQNAEHVVIASRIDAQLAGYESGQGVTSFGCAFTALPATGVFRSPHQTPRPTVAGPQTAVVVGTSGMEIDTDEYGRVKLHFHWDRLGQKNEKSSCWVRVSHPLAGKGFGMLALPRIGQEVIVDFLEGDPDRPIVTGRVYNAVQTVPYALPDHKTVATIKTRSTMEGTASNFNELRFEDKKGSEYVWFQAEKDFYQYVKHDAWLVVDNDQRRLVKNDLQEEIRHDVQRTVGNDLKDKVANNLSLEVGNNAAHKVGGAWGLKVTGDLVMESGAAISAKSGADMVQKVGANLGVEAAANVHLKGGANVVIEAGAMLTLKCGGGSVVIGPANVAITGAMVLINSGGGGGSGGGASPKTPEATQPPEAPEPPVDPLA